MILRQLPMTLLSTQALPINIFLGMVHQLCLMMNLVLHLGDLVRFIIQELLKMEKCHLSLPCLSCIKIYIMLLQKRYKVMDYLI